MLHQLLCAGVDHQLGGGPLHNCYAHVDVTDKLAGGAVSCGKAQLAHGKLGHLGNVVENYAGGYKLSAEGRIKLAVYIAYAVRNPEHGVGVVKESAPHGVVELVGGGAR